MVRWNVSGLAVGDRFFKAGAGGAWVGGNSVGLFGWADGTRPTGYFTIWSVRGPVPRLYRLIVTAIGGSISATSCAWVRG